MYVVYHDVGGTHSTVIAAAIHLNRLPMDMLPSMKDILNVPLFDKLEKKDQGRLIYHGQDEYGNQIYTIHRQYVPQLITNTIGSVFDMVGRDRKEILFVDTSVTVNHLMRIGGGSSRRLGLVAFGRPLVAYGTLKAYPKIVAVVQKTKLKVAP